MVRHIYYLILFRILFIYLFAGRLIETLAIKREPLITLHANYVTGNQKKANKMKKYGLWLAEIQENGSFTCHPYVPYIWTNETSSE